MAAAQTVVAAALLGATCIYAFFTWLMAKEMRTSRLLSIRPRLALAVDPLSTFQGLLSVHNLGPGTACDVELKLTFKPHGATREWKTPFLLRDEKVQFKPIGLDGEKEYKLQELAQASLVVRLEGSMLDIQGHRYAVADEVNIATWWDMALRSDQRVVDELGERVVRELASISKVLSKGGS